MEETGSPKHYHLIGIAGTAMGSLAGLLREKGHRVSGSDQGVYPPMSELLERMGIRYATTFDPANVEDPDVVVVGNAVSRGNPELESVLERRLYFTSAAEVIRLEFLQRRHVLAVSGTHGKTTTASLLAWLLEVCELRPSFLIGGVAENFATSFRSTDSEFFVIEADEYDTAYFDKGPKMWHYQPWTAVVTNVEFDHADIYRDETQYRFAFERFVNLIPRPGTLVVGWDSPHARDLSTHSHAPVQSFGVPGEGSFAEQEHHAVADGGPPGQHPRWRAEAVEYGPNGTAFDVFHDGTKLGRAESTLAGAFNVRNALAAIAAAHATGAPWGGIAEGLRTFRSVRRRMEVRGEVGGVSVIDDFAHHPTAVGETLKAVRQRFPGRRVVALFEPRSYTAQRREFQDAYREALRGADRVVLAGLFHPERYDGTTGMDPEELTQSLRNDGVDARYEPDVDQIVAWVSAEARSGDVVLVMSNGSFGGIHGKLLDALGALRGG